MKDQFGREINYLRVSITDRCNLRCKYCMPSYVPGVPHEDILRYEELMRICRAAVSLGIDRFKITGGEPFVRKGTADFIAQLKAEPGVKNVTVTTNGTGLHDALPRLIQVGVDGVNVSLDAVDADKYSAITGAHNADQVISAIQECAASGICTKINCVLLETNADQVVPLAALAQELSVDVRFIELMPIGYGREFSGPSSDATLEQLRQVYPDLRFTDETRGNGPAVYYQSAKLLGRIGFIGANSHIFCGQCNRVRLTSIGFIKPCLCYEFGRDLRALLRGGATDLELATALAEAIFKKPSAHNFAQTESVTEHKRMNQIGG